jgi:hypothetical protein
MEPLRKQVSGTTLEIVWRNPFPLRRERARGSIKMVKPNHKITAASWFRKLMKACELSRPAEASLSWATIP